MPVLFRSTGTLRVPEFALRRGGALKSIALPHVCAIVPRANGLLLINTGWSRAQCAWPDADLGLATRLVRGLHLRAEDALASQVLSLGFDPKDVTDIVLTSLAREHVSGAVDFPAATLHVSDTEWEAQARLIARSSRNALPGTLADRVKIHQLTGPAMLGFGSSRDLFGDGSVFLMPAPGPTRGSTAVAVKLEKGWFVHAGNLCALRDEQLAPVTNAPWLFDRLRSVDALALTGSLAAMRDASLTHAAVIVPSSDPYVFATLPTTLEAAWPAAGDPAPGAKKQQQAHKQKSKRDKVEASDPV